jgi:hypothetical protein
LPARRIPIEDLRKRPCRRGHSRHDAYVMWDYRHGGPPYPWLRCRTCFMQSPSYARLKANLKAKSTAEKDMRDIKLRPAPIRDPNLPPSCF